jgi:hypothetical protein
VACACGSPDPNIDQYGLKTLRAIKTYPESRCISFLYDLDDDDMIDVIKCRRWTDQGNLSAPIKAYYDKNGDMDISCDEIAKWKEPLPEAGPCPPRKKTGPAEI